MDATNTKIVTSAAKATSYNMVLQFGLRMTTFVLNGFILRYVSQETLGVVNVRLTLLYSTISFLAKEAIERACLSKLSQTDWRQNINLMWCTVPLAAVISTLLGVVWLFALSLPTSSTASQGMYTAGVVCFGSSAVIEVLAEPLYIVGQTCHFVKLKVIIFGLAQGIKCVFTVMFVLIAPEWGIFSFSIAQVISSASFVILYHGYFAHYIRNNSKKDDEFPLKSVRDMYPCFIQDKPLIDSHLAGLTTSFFKQSLFKQILTEGERYVMTFLDVLSFGDQGVYDVTSNLGSLVARFVFQPIESSSYLLFSQLLVRGVTPDQQKKNDFQLAAKVLGVLLKVVTLIGAVIVVFGYSNSYLALHLYGGDILSGGIGPTLLRWCCLYVLVIALNGTTEAFVFAAMKKEEVDRYNHKMLLFSGVFLFSSWLLTRWLGSVGFILANCVNMGARIVHSLIFIRNYFSGTNLNPLKETRPSGPVIVSLFLSFAITAVSEHLLCQRSSVLLHKMCHILVSGACLLLVLVTIYLTEHSMVSVIKEQFTRSKSSSSSEAHSKKDS